MADNFQDEGTVEVWIRHDHEDWATNSDGYDFGTFTKEGVTVSTAKHPDKTIEFDVDGAVIKRPVAGGRSGKTSSSSDQPSLIDTAWRVHRFVGALGGTNQDESD